MWPFKKSPEAQDKGTMIAIQLDIPTKGMPQDAIEPEFRKRLELFIADAERRYGAHGLRHRKTVFSTQGHGAVMFELPKSDRTTIDISQELMALWDRFSGW